MADFLQHIIEIQETGSTSAFHRLVQLFEGKVFTLCYRIIGNREEAEEAAQDVFLNCYKNLHKIQDPNKFPQWLLKIAYSRSIDYVRKKKITKVNIEHIREIPGDVNQRHTKGELGTSETFEVVLKMLPPADVALINLYYQESMSVKEIADLMDMSVSNVKVRLHRSRAEIRRILEAKMMNKTKG